MAKYRFKTKAEFQADGDWNSWDNIPCGWNQDMAYRVGQPVPSDRDRYCDKGESFYIDEPNGETWHYCSSNYVLNEDNSDSDFVILKPKMVNL